MIGVVVTFSPQLPFDRDAVAKIAEGARHHFEGMPGLRQKVFTVDADGSRARNVYLWDDEETARAFFTDELVDRVTGLYGVRPTVELVEILALVDNA
jgi:heme-degrading monooxygenase HmoA